MLMPTSEEHKRTSSAIDAELQLAKKQLTERDSQIEQMHPACAL
jgi:hypothetical protein